MKAHHRLAAVLFPGAAVAYLTGALTTRWTNNALFGSSLCIVVTVVAIYAGWRWAEKGGRS